MKRLVSLILLAGLALAVAGSALDKPPEADARTRGVALGLFASETTYDYADLVHEIRGRGATDILIVVQWSQATPWSSEVERDPTRTAPDHVVERTIRQAQQEGMRVTVMPIIRLRERTANQWRGNIAPSADDWFESYGERLDELAVVTERAGADRLVIGSELGSMLKHENDWRSLIQQTRNTYSGELVYSANWDNFTNVPFWDAVDVAGVTGYFPLDGHASYDEAWKGPRKRLRDLRTALQKPVILTEVGYPSHSLAAQMPWDQTASTDVDIRLQARLYRSFCDNIANDAAVDGYFAWNWFGFGGPTDTSFTPRGKPAAAELERCLTRR